MKQTRRGFFRLLAAIPAAAVAGLSWPTGYTHTINLIDGSYTRESNLYIDGPDYVNTKLSLYRLIEHGVKKR